MVKVKTHQDNNELETIGIFKYFDNTVNKP